MGDATRALQTDRSAAQANPYDALLGRLERLEHGWTTHLPAMLDAISTALGKSREEEASHDRIEMLEEELDRVRNLVDDLVAAFNGAIQRKPSKIASWLLVQAAGHGLRLRLGQWNGPAEEWVELLDIVGSPPVFLLGDGQSLDIAGGHIECLHIGADVVAAWPTERLLAMLEQIAPLLSGDGEILISADDDTRRRMSAERMGTTAIRLIPDGGDPLLARGVSPK